MDGDTDVESVVLGLSNALWPGQGQCQKNYQEHCEFKINQLYYYLVYAQIDQRSSLRSPQCLK